MTVYVTVEEEEDDVEPELVAPESVVELPVEDMPSPSVVVVVVVVVEELPAEPPASPPVPVVVVLEELPEAPPALLVVVDEDPD